MRTHLRLLGCPLESGAACPRDRMDGAERPRGMYALHACIDSTGWVDPGGIIELVLLVWWWLIECEDFDHNREVPLLVPLKGEPGSSAFAAVVLETLGKGQSTIS